MFKKAPQIGHDVPAAQESNSKWLWVGLAAVAFLAVIVAFSISSSDSSDEIVNGEVSASGKVLPDLTPEIINDDPAVGFPAPSLTGQSFDGSAVVVESGDGVPKVLVFLAHWCSVCQKEVPEVVSWYENGGSVEGVEVVGISTYSDRLRGNYPPGSWLSGERWPFATIVDNENNLAATAYGLTGFPYFVAVDADGNVVSRTGGDIGADGFEQLVDAARTGTPTVVIPKSATAAPTTTTPG